MVHPDRCRHPQAHELMQRLTEAYECLSDVNERAQYDLCNDGLNVQQSNHDDDDLNHGTDADAGVSLNSDQYVRAVLSLYGLSDIQDLSIQSVSDQYIVRGHLSESVCGLYVRSVQASIPMPVEAPNFKDLSVRLDERYCGILCWLNPPHNVLIVRFCLLTVKIYGF